jgi:putative spermidine/putrescine transport system permease protein
MADAGASSGRVIPGQTAGVDRTVLLVVPGVLFVILLFIYPFLYGLGLSFTPKEGGLTANYAKFFSTPYLAETIGTTLSLAIPATMINVGLALPIAFHLRRSSRPQRIISGLLVVPITLGTVLVAEGLLAYLGPQGWFNRIVMELGLSASPLKLTHSYWGVLMSLVITGFPFDFLLILSYVTGIDPALSQAAATLGAKPIQRFRQIYLPLLAPGLVVVFCLAFVLSFSVFPSAILLGNPSSSTRVIAIAAYQAAYEDHDHSMASAIAMIMCAVQLAIVVAILSVRSLFYRGPAGGAKG